MFSSHSDIFLARYSQWSVRTGHQSATYWNCNYYSSSFSPLCVFFQQKLLTKLGSFIQPPRHNLFGDWQFNHLSYTFALSIRFMAPLIRSKIDSNSVLNRMDMVKKIWKFSNYHLWLPQNPLRDAVIGLIMSHSFTPVLLAQLTSVVKRMKLWPLDEKVVSSYLSLRCPASPFDSPLLASVFFAKMINIIA